MMFLMYGLIFGALTAAIPIVVHLLHRQKTVPIAWGAMQFLLDSALQQKRHKKIDHWLLLLVRMAALIVLALLLARPLIPTAGYSRLAGSTTADIAVVVDHSLSMGRMSGTQSLFAQTVGPGGPVERLLALLRPHDTFSLVLSEHTPRVLTSQPLQRPADLEELRRTLRSIKPGLTDGAIPAAVLAARDLVNHGRNLRKVILIISDEQRSDWQLDTDRAWRMALGDRAAGPDKDIRVYAIPARVTAPATNLALGNVTLEPGLVGVNRPAQVLATLTNQGPADMPATTLQLSIDGQLTATQQSQPLPAGQSQTVRFDCTFPSPAPGPASAGSHWVKVQVDVVDGLAADNTAYAAVNVIPRLPVLVIDGQLSGAGSFRSSAFLQAALQPVAGAPGNAALVEPTILSVTDVGNTLLDDYPVIILNDVPRLPADLVGRLRDYVQSGHGLWIILGPRTDPTFLNDTLAKSQLFAGRAGAIQEPPPGAVITPRVEDRDHPLLALFTAAERNAFTGIALTRWWKIELPADRQGEDRILLATSAQRTSDAAPPPASNPLVLERELGRNGGRVILWTTSVDGTWNNLPLAANFVPLANETVFHLAAGQKLNRRLDAGQTIVWTGPADTPVETGLLTRPDGGPPKKIAPILTGGHYLITYSDTYAPGLYELHFSPPAIPQPVFYTVSLDRRELDPATLAPRDWEFLKSERYLTDRATIETVAEALGAEGRGLELWPLGALLLLALLVLETYLTRRLMSLQAGHGATDLDAAAEGRAG